MPITGCLAAWIKSLRGEYIDLKAECESNSGRATRSGRNANRGDQMATKLPSVCATDNSLLT